jgi:O-antigen/teichoic acid export membrane protein
MGKTKVIFKNSSFLAISAVVSKFLSFLLFVVIARYLGPTDLGKYAFAISFTGMFMVLSEFGLGILAVRDVSADKSLGLNYISNIALLKFVLCGLALVVVSLLVLILGYPAETVKIVALVGLAVFLPSAAGGMRWYFQVEQKLEYESILNITSSLLFLVLGIMALMLKGGILGVVFSQAIVGIATLLLSWLIVQKRFVKFKFEFNLPLWKKLLVKATPFALMAICTSLYLNADTVLLSFFKGNTAVGWYNASNRLIQAGKMVPAIVMPALFPVMAGCFKSSRQEFNDLLEKGLVFMFLVAFPLSLSITLLADKITLLLYGEKFIPTIMALRILSWGMFGVFFSSILGYTLISANRQKINTIITAIGLGTSVAFNLALMPKLGHIGTSIAITATEWIVFLLAGYYVRKHLNFDFGRIVKPFGKVVLATTVSGLCIFWVKQYSFVLAAISGISIYIVCILLLKGFYGYDYTKIKRIILNKLHPIQTSSIKVVESSDKVGIGR